MWLFYSPRVWMTKVLELVGERRERHWWELILGAFTVSMENLQTTLFTLMSPFSPGAKHKAYNTINYSIHKVHRRGVFGPHWWCCVPPLLFSPFWFMAKWLTCPS